MVDGVGTADADGAEADRLSPARPASAAKTDEADGAEAAPGSEDAKAASPKQKASLLQEGGLTAADPSLEASTALTLPQDESIDASPKQDTTVTTAFLEDGISNTNADAKPFSMDFDFLKDRSLSLDQKVDEMDDEQVALVKGALEDAAIAREDLVIQWREVCKPRRAGAIAPKSKGSRKDFAPLFIEWLAARGLDDALMEDGYSDGWKKYRYLREPKVMPEDNWEVAYHGTWWYSVWLVLHSGVFLESNDRDKGHDFWEPGVYCSPNLATARWYARPHILFGDGVYHRIIFELRVNTEKRIRNRQRGGVQWVFKPDAVSLYAVWVQRNAPPANGEERINDWDPKLEARPPGEALVNATVNPREERQADEWSETEPDEEGEEEPEDQPLPPHLHASNHFQKYALPTSKSLPPATGSTAASGAHPIFSRLAPTGMGGTIPSAKTQQSLEHSFAVSGSYAQSNGFGPRPVPPRPTWTPTPPPPSMPRWKPRSTPRGRIDHYRPAKRKRELTEEEKLAQDEWTFEEFLKQMKRDQEKKEEASADATFSCMVGPLKSAKALAMKSE
ncbi:Uncharacterized protein SCF082_LOCUS14551 [Durusdinium trenchii]|uniref:Uncharacterized protein n=1 Tax=Durusdinium trenchii TaxID=1381693 RepID=A0ABP0JYD0_9DINO